MKNVLKAALLIGALATPAFAGDPTGPVAPAPTAPAKDEAPISAKPVDGAKGKKAPVKKDEKKDQKEGTEKKAY